MLPEVPLRRRFSVSHVRDDEYVVPNGQHDLFVTSVATSTAHAAGRYLARHGLSREGLTVLAEYVTDPGRVARIRLTVRVPHELPRPRQVALHEIVERCSVAVPEIEVRVERSASSHPLP